MAPYHRAKRAKLKKLRAKIHVPAEGGKAPGAMVFL
jgi:hypothetical protein